MSGAARGNDEIALDWALLWWEVGQMELDTLPIELSLEHGIVNVAFDK